MIMSYAQMYNQEYPPDKVPNTTETPRMEGFVNDYANAIAASLRAEKGL